MKFHNIRDVIKVLSKSNEEKVTLKYENILVRMLSVPVLLLGSIVNFVVMYLIWGQHSNITLINTFSLLIFALTFNFFSRVINDEKLKSYIQSALLSAVLGFVVVRFYYLIGPTVWTISIMLVVISMMRTKVSMLIIVTLTIFVLGMYSWSIDYPFQMGSDYYIAQTVSFSILFLITGAVYTIITNRYKKVYEQYKYILSSDNKINVLIDMEAKIKKLAYYDHLTGLPNRRLFNDKLNQCIVDTAQSQKTLGILFLDLDSFKRINDTMGHSKGDELLKMVSSRLKDTLKKGDTISRVGGDEFLVLIENLEYEHHIMEISKRVLDIFNDPFIIDSHDLYITTSIGGAIYPIDGEDVETLIKNADISMYQAKDMGKNKFELCTPLIKKRLFEEMRLTNSLYGALERNELELYYQPQVSLTSGKISGLEALIRWNNTELGLVNPVDFIYIAEKTGLILPIGEWVLKSACIQNKAWQDAGILNVPIAVNLSVNQFQNTKIVEQITKILRETHLAPNKLELEITENIIMKEPEYIIDSLTQLKALGIKIAIDDFGTEYSSLNYIKQLPIDRIKIAMSFIQGININEKDEAIIKVIMVLARNLGLKVIAEGVETMEQLDFLKNEMCDDVQGYYFYKPMPANKIEDLLTENLQSKTTSTQI